VHRTGDNLGMNPSLPEDKLCTSCGFRNSSRIFSETPCAPCRNRRRTTPTPSTTGGPLGGNSGGGTKRETADDRRGPTTTFGHAENDRRAREQVLRNRFPQEKAPRSRIPGEGQRETADRSRRPSSAHGGRRCERRATEPRPRVRDHGAASGRPRARRRPDARTAARTPVRAVGATRPQDRRTCRGPLDLIHRGARTSFRMPDVGPRSRHRHDEASVTRRSAPPHDGPAILGLGSAGD
jgi:hypothetical protein